MTIRHLRIFAAVVDCGTMHAAAQKLYLSQPTITQAVKELEEHYGCLLFERYGRRLMITPAGQELLGHARELLGVYERMEQSMKQQAGQKQLPPLPMGIFPAAACRKPGNICASTGKD